MTEGKSSKGRPKAPTKAYDRTLVGVIGRMGAKDSSISYVQVNLPVAELALLGLVSEIPGSEKWPIRQLFQRDIDSERVGKDIIPYFLDSAMSKFFNPLTIAVLPIDSHGSFSSVKSEEACPPNSEQPYDRAFSLDSFYRISSVEGEPWALVEWNSSKVKLIAIDGQHRLSALKRIYAMYQKDPKDPKIVSSDFCNWIIPIVLVTVGHKESGSLKGGALLERTRNIFVTINKQAKAPSRTRTILLNDFSVLAVASQEILDNCGDHGVSLALFNWREYKDEDLPGESAFLMGVDELEDILKEYLLGEDEENNIGLELSGRQREALFWTDLGGVGAEVANTSKFRDLIKTRFKETVLPSFFHILKNVKPYSTYVGFIRDLETNLKDDTRKHAWSRLVYGTDYAPGIIEAAVTKEKISILEACRENKSKLGEIFGKAIGLRGIYSGFNQYYEHLCSKVSIAPWEDVAKDFVEHFNSLYDDGHFSDKKLPTHVAIDHGGIIVNYRLESVPKALGAYIAYCCLYTSSKRDEFELSELRDTLLKTLVSGYKKEHRRAVKDELTGQPPAKINLEISERAQRSATSEMAKLDRRLNKSLR